MVLHDHPFSILGVGTRSKKSEILERTQSLLLTEDADRVQSAVAVITHPSKRIDAEVSWFPGMRPAQLTDLLPAVDKSEDIAHVERTFGGLDPLTYLNLLYYWTIRHTALNHQLWVTVLQKMAHRSAEIQVVDVIDLLNADRTAAAIPQIVDQSQVASALQRRKFEVVDSVLTHVLKTAQPELVISDVVDRFTNSGLSFANDFVYRLVDEYGVAIQPALHRCRDEIHEICVCIASRAGESPKADATDELTRLDTVVAEWTRLTKPIQQAMKSRGLGDQQTIEIAQHVRSVAIDLANNSSLYSQARQITATLHRAFEENPVIAELTRNDLQTLDELLSEKAEQENSSPAIKHLRALCSDVRQECRSGVVRKEGFSDANKRVCAESLQRFRNEIEPALNRLRLSSPSDSEEILKARELAAQCLSAIGIDYTWGDAFIFSEKLQMEALALAEGTAAASSIEEALKQVGEAANAQREHKQQEEERKRQTELDIPIGNDRLVINEEFISYAGRRLKTEEVRRLRWGVYKHYINGIRTSRQFTIWIGSRDSSRDIEIECVRFLESQETIAKRFQTIISTLWRVVGIRVVMDWVQHLTNGETIEIGGTQLSKKGMVLSKRVWLKREAVFVPWEELAQVTSQGNLIVTSSKDRKASISMSLRDVDNAVLLSNLLDLLWKDGNYAKLRDGTLFRS